jgi:hypothetical protein
VSSAGTVVRVLAAPAVLPVGGLLAARAAAATTPTHPTIPNLTLLV